MFNMINTSWVAISVSAHKMCCPKVHFQSEIVRLSCEGFKKEKHLPNLYFKLFFVCFYIISFKCICFVLLLFYCFFFLYLPLSLMEESTIAMTGWQLQMYYEKITYKCQGKTV